MVLRETRSTSHTFVILYCYKFRRNSNWTVLVLTQTVAHLVKHFAINAKIKAKRRFDDTDIIIRLKWWKSWKLSRIWIRIWIPKLMDQFRPNNGLRTDLVTARWPKIVVIGRNQYSFGVVFAFPSIPCSRYFNDHSPSLCNGLHYWPLPVQPITSKVEVTQLSKPMVFVLKISKWSTVSSKLRVFSLFESTE